MQYYSTKLLQKGNDYNSRKNMNNSAFPKAL